MFSWRRVYDSSGMVVDELGGAHRAFIRDAAGELRPVQNGCDFVNFRRAMQAVSVARSAMEANPDAKI